MTYLMDFTVAIAKVSVAPIVAFVFVAIAVGMLNHAGGDERLCLLMACFVLLAVTISNAIVFWRSGMYRTALVGGGLWIAYVLACLWMVLAFWRE